MESKGQQDKLWKDFLYKECCFFVFSFGITLFKLRENLDFYILSKKRFSKLHLLFNFLKLEFAEAP